MTPLKWTYAMAVVCSDTRDGSTLLNYFMRYREDHIRTYYNRSPLYYTLLLDGPIKFYVQSALDTSSHYKCERESAVIIPPTFTFYGFAQQKVCDQNLSIQYSCVCIHTA